MKRSLQEIIELAVFALIALIVGTGVLWLVGWLIGLLGSLFMIVAGFLWSLLTYLIPVAIIAAAVYFLVKLAQRQSQQPAEGTTAQPSHASPPPPPTVAPSPAPQATPPNAESTEQPTPTVEETQKAATEDETKRQGESESRSQEGDGKQPN